MTFCPISRLEKSILDEPGLVSHNRLRYIGALYLDRGAAASQSVKQTFGDQPDPFRKGSHMGKAHRAWILLTALVVFLPAVQLAVWAADETNGQKDKTPEFGISHDLGDAASRQAGQVRQQIARKARSLFKREPLGFDWKTAEYLYDRMTALPLQIPDLMKALVEQSRLLGFVGSVLIFIFLVALVYSLLGQKRAMKRVVTLLAPQEDKIPKSIYPYILSAIRVVIAALFPLVLLAAFSLINALITYDAAWFRLIGRLLLLWSAGSLVINLLRELLTREFFGIGLARGRSLFRPSRLVVLYSVFAIGSYWAAVAFELRQDVLALMQFVITLSIIGILFLLLLKKNALLSMLPDFPHTGYRKFVKFFTKYYFLLITLSLFLGVLWGLGYRDLGRVMLVKIWASVAVYLLIMTVFHVVIGLLKRWYEGTDREDEAAGLMYRSVKSLLVYTTLLATVLLVLNLLGLLGVLKQVMSFPVFILGTTGVTLWIILEAILILLAFIYSSRLLQAYLDYRVYPAVGVEPGLGYAINTFLKYLMLAVGFLIALNVVGLDLRFLFVFAGAVGIGVGMGLQSMAANVISGFTLIFGGKLRKGDWIEVADTMGMVTDIYLRATNVRTRDNIDYLIPNTEFISDTLVNYSLGSPLIRIEVPVGVSYDADPQVVSKILLDAAAREQLVSKEKAPAVRFVAFGDSSINFELLIWINVRTTPRRRVRSELYYAIFAELAKAGIEIPFPQRDIHVRSMVEG
jgi:small-conductance mechanosensitive channel